MVSVRRTYNWFKEDNPIQQLKKGILKEYSIISETGYLKS
jgi:hypothetical protein